MHRTDNGAKISTERRKKENAERGEGKEVGVGGKGGDNKEQAAHFVAGISKFSDKLTGMGGNCPLGPSC